MTIEEFMVKFPYDPWDDYGIDPGPQSLDRSLQAAIRQAVKNYDEGSPNALPWLSFAVLCLQADDPLRIDVIDRFPDLSPEWHPPLLPTGVPT